MLVDLDGFRARCAPLRESLRRFDWSNVATADDDRLQVVVERSRAQRSASARSGAVPGAGTEGEEPR
ncbi:MAG: hypothetical protein R2789_16915 [Microthrixaceae bacterium]